MHTQINDITCYHTSNNHQIFINHALRPFSKFTKNCHVGIDSFKGGIDNFTKGIDNIWKIDTKLAYCFPNKKLIY